MGLRFSNFVILFGPLFFGWKPSPTSRGIISSLLMQSVESPTPCRPGEMGAVGFRAYEYVGDGACAEQLRDTRPWTSIRMWELGVQTCLGKKALHADKKRVEGSCATRIVLWGLVLCTIEGNISLPEDKIISAQQFLAQPCFGPGVARIPLVAIQELRGKADRWSLRNESIGPELHVIDQLSMSYS